MWIFLMQVVYWTIVNFELYSVANCIVFSKSVCTTLFLGLADLFPLKKIGLLSFDEYMVWEPCNDLERALRLYPVVLSTYCRSTHWFTVFHCSHFTLHFAFYHSKSTFPSDIRSHSFHILITYSNPCPGYILYNQSDAMFCFWTVLVYYL
jgi:hypothetical protein